MVKAIPDKYPQLMPYLCVDGAEAAIAFYTDVFGGIERMRMPGLAGTVAHAEIQIGSAVIMLSDPFPHMDVLDPKAIGGTPVAICLYVEDVDAVFESAIAKGAKAIRPVSNQFYGDRSGMIEDPFGHRWNLSTHIEDVSSEEMARRMATMMTDENEKA